MKNIEFSWPIAQIVYQHNERMDGSRYPDSLPGEEIILEARVIAVADMVSAMTSHRPYRPALSMHEVLKGLSKHKGVLYDPEVVEACLKVINEGGYMFK